MIVKTGRAEKPDVCMEGRFSEQSTSRLCLDYGTITVIPSLEEEKPHQILIGLGKEEDLTEDRLRELAAKAARAAAGLNAEQAELRLPIPAQLNENRCAAAVTEGALLSDFSFDRYKTGAPEKKELVLYLGLENAEKLESVVAQASVLAQAINQIRPLVAEPCNVLYPQTLADWVVNAGKEYGFETQILDETQIQKKQLNALYAVGMGSQNQPRLIVMRYCGAPEKERLGLVGKGITCDTGGYCVKNASSLPYIKGDMAGAANVIGLMCALAKNKCPVNVVGIVPSAENRISSNSYLPGDVIRSFSGKTIEVLNTDCEGRMVLADALTYAVREEKADRLVDMATLTGLAGTTFGSLYTPMFGSDEGFNQAFLEAAKNAAEDFWPMPVDDRYKDYIRSGVADLSNKADAGSITAAMFLKEFTEGKPWIHLDIAATAIQYPIVHEYAKDAPSGIGIRTLYELLGGYTG